MSGKHPLADCDNCELQKKGLYVKPDFNGNITAKYVIVGEAPGFSDTKKGKPFTGQTGKLLDMTMQEHGVNKKDAVLTNITLCGPSSSGGPSANAVECCKPALDDVLEQVKPEYVVAVGNSAASAMLGKSTKITKDRVGPPKDVGKDYKVIATVHPAACLRNPNLFPLFAADIGKLKPQVQIIWEPPEFRTYDGPKKASKAIHQLLNSTRMETLVVDLEVGEEKDNTFGHPNTLLAAGMAYAPGKAVVLGQSALNHSMVRADFSKLLKEKKVVCHNGKYDLGVLYRMHFGTFKLFRDTMLMAYTLDEVPGTKGLKYLGQEKLGTPDWDSVLEPYIKGKDGGWSKIPKDILYKYNAFDVAVTWDLMELLGSEMDDDDWKLHEMLCRASDQLMIIESEGVYVDQELLDELEWELNRDMISTKQDLTTMVKPHLDNFDARIKRLIVENDGFNPNSPDQVRAALQLMINARLTSTDIDTLQLLAKHRNEDARLFANKMITWRKTSKLYGTYVKGTKERLNEDGRIQTSYLLHGTETGRLSSRNPNVQNVPRESEYANFRKIYAAEPGNRIIYADYSNIEGRVVAVLADDEAMMEVLRDPSRDIHSEMATAIYGPNFTKENRVSAKTVVHGKNYARTAYGIAEGLGIPTSEADKISKAYDKRYKKVKLWHQKIKHQVLQTDEVLITPFGRKRRFGLITRDNAEDVYKEALAFKPQSIGSDICLTAAIRLKEYGLPVRILIHDGIVVEVPEDEVPAAMGMMKEVMEESAKVFTEKVPFPVDIAVGHSWGDVD